VRTNCSLGLVVTGSLVLGDEVGRIAAIAVVVAVCVVVRIHRRHVVRVTTVRTARRRRWQHRTVSIVVVAVVTGAIVVARTWSNMDDHPRLVAIAIPAEAYRLEVFEGGEAVELTVEFVVRHHSVDPGGIWTISRYADRNPSDTTRTYSHVLRGVAVTVVGIEIYVEITTISVISDILNIIVDGDRIGVVGQHGL
jgi:hypothetical protein